MEKDLANLKKKYEELIEELRQCNKEKQEISNTCIILENELNNIKKDKSN